MKRCFVSVIGLLFVTSFALAQVPMWLYEGFETDWAGGAPAGWTKSNVVGNVDWDQKKGVLTGAGVPKASGANQRAAVAWFPSSTAPVGTITRIESPVMNFTDSTRVRARFFYVNVSGTDTLWVKASTDGGATWVAVQGFGTTAGDGTWKQGYAVLDSYLGNQPNAKIGFEAVADSGTSDIWLDRVVVQYPVVRIVDLQQVPAESLMTADGIPNFSLNTNQPRWTLQSSPYLGDTMIVPALVVVPLKVITYTAQGWTMLLYDTAQVSQWKGLLLRASIDDSTQLTADGFYNVAPGDVITVTGTISEFPSSRGFSLTQFQPVAGHNLDIVGSAPLPKPIVMNVGDFYTGIFSTGKVQYATGEPFESMLVEFHNLTVDGKVNPSRGTFSAVDELGNEISDYDYSRYFTLQGSSADHPGPDPLWSQIYAGLGVGVRIDTLRGVIATSAQSEGPRGYRVAPLYYGDVVIGFVPPLISTHRRNPVVVSPDSTPVVSVRVSRLPGGSAIQVVSLYYSVDGSPFAPLTMAFRAADTTYAASIPMQSANSVVRYFMTAMDSLLHTVVLANSSLGGAATDTSLGFFFYTVLNRPITIRDVQYTPYVVGRTPYLGAVISLSGIVTADTAHIALSPKNSGWTSAWYMQSSNQPWSGIWLTTSDSATQAQMAAVRNGDSITVTGTVQEQFEVTRLGNLTAVVKHSSGNPEPAPVVLPTGNFNVGNGIPSAEAYEGMLVRFNNVAVTDTNPTYSDQTEYSVSDGSSAVVVQQGGRNDFSNMRTDTGKTILKLGDKISSLTGIVYYSFNQYKFVPRTNADFGVVTDVPGTGSATKPTVYALEQNYPNPFNPTTAIQYAIPAANHVTLRVYNLLGQEIGSLVDQVQESGRYTVQFDASSLSTGIYFYRIQAGQFTQVKKMMFVK